MADVTRRTLLTQLTNGGTVVGVAGHNLDEWRDSRSPQRQQNQECRQRRIAMERSEQPPAVLWIETPPRATQGVETLVLVHIYVPDGNLLDDLTDFVNPEQIQTPVLKLIVNQGTITHVLPGHFPENVTVTGVNEATPESKVTATGLEPPWQEGKHAVFGCVLTPTSGVSATTVTAVLGDGSTIAPDTVEAAISIPTNAEPKRISSKTEIACLATARATLAEQLRPFFAGGPLTESAGEQLQNALLTVAVGSQQLLLEAVAGSVAGAIGGDVAETAWEALNLFASVFGTIVSVDDTTARGNLVIELADYLIPFFGELLANPRALSQRVQQPMVSQRRFRLRVAVILVALAAAARAEARAWRDGNTKQARQLLAVQRHVITGEHTEGFDSTDRRINTHYTQAAKKCPEWESTSGYCPSGPGEAGTITNQHHFLRESGQLLPTLAQTSRRAQQSTIRIRETLKGEAKRIKHLLAVTAPDQQRSDATDGEWSMFGGGPARTGTASTSTSQTNFTPPTKNDWPISFETEPTNPVIADGTLYISSGYGGKVYAFDPETGGRQWTWGGDDTRRAGMVTVTNETVYIPVEVTATDSKVYALDATTGEEKTGNWPFESQPRLGRRAVTVANGTGYIDDNTQGYGLNAFDAQTGTPRSGQWPFRPNNGAVNNTAVANQTVYVMVAHHIYALNATTGTQQDDRWPVNVSPRGSIAVADGRVFAGSSNGSVYALDASTGEEHWQTAVSSPDFPVNGSPAVSDDTVYVGCNNNTAAALNAATGTKRWQFDTEAEVYRSPAVVDNTVYIASSSPGHTPGYVYAVDAQTGTLRDGNWPVMFDSTYRFKGPTVVGGTVYIATVNEDNSDTSKLYTLDAETGEQY